MDGLSDNTKLHMKVERLVTIMEATNTNINRMANTLYHDEKGVVVKLDRLNVAHKNQKKLTFAAAGTAIALILKSGWEWVTNLGGHH